MHGAYTLSLGTFEPAIVLRRLLHAWRLLDPAAYAGSPLGATAVAAVPAAALTDPEHPWWGSEAATTIVEEVVGAIGRAVAPHGLCVNVSEPDRIELVLLDTDHSESTLPDRSSSPPSSPAVSALRQRVRPR